MTNTVSSFTEHPVPAHIRAVYDATTLSVRAYSAKTHAGDLHVIYSQHQVGRRTFSFFTASVGSPGQLKPTRRPTDEEIEAIKFGLFGVRRFQEEQCEEPNTRAFAEVAA